LAHKVKERNNRKSCLEKFAETQKKKTLKTTKILPEVAGSRSMELKDVLRAR